MKNKGEFIDSYFLFPRNKDGLSERETIENNAMKDSKERRIEKDLHKE